MGDPSKPAMRLQTAAFGATILSFIYCIAAAIWYVVPWLKQTEQPGALTTLFWVHVFRHVAFQIFSAQKFGLEVPDKVRNQIAYGDVATSVLGFIAIAVLHFEWSFAILLVWIFSVVSVADLVNAMIGGIRSNILDKAYGGHLTNTQLLCPSVMDNAGFDFLVAAGMRYRVNYQ